MSRSGLLAFLLSTSVAAGAWAGADFSLGLDVPPKSPIGATVSMAMEVDNLGPDSGGTFTATYTPPPGYSFVAITSYQSNAGSISCTGPAPGSNGGIACSGSVRLGAGPSVSFDYKVSSSVTPGTSMTSTATMSSSNDPNPANNSATITSIANAIPDLQPSIALPATYTPGVDFHFTAGLKNNGPGAATNVALFLKTFLAMKSMTQTAGPTMQCTNGDCRVSSLAAGDQVVFDVVASPSSGYLGYATATVEGALTDYQYITAPASGAAARAEASNLSVSSSAPATGKIGDDLQYKVYVANAGPSTATNVTVTWTTPPGTTFLSDFGGGSCTALQPGSSGTVTCTLSQVDTLLGSTVFFDARVVGGGTIVNSATVSCASDTTPSNNTTSATTIVNDTPHADLSVALATDPYAIAGRPTAVPLTFRNDGPSIAQGVSANVVLSSGVMFDSSSDCSATCAAGDLAAGATVTKTLRIVAGSGVANASVTATVTSSTPDLNPANDSASASLRVYPAVADLVVTAPSPVAPIGPGSEVAVTVTVANRGPAPAAATLTFSVPFGLQLFRGNGCSVAGSNATCTSAEIAPSTAAAFAIAFLGSPGYYTINFHAASTLLDPNPADNDAVVNVVSVGVDPVPLPSVAVSVFPTEVTAEPGAPVAFGVVVTSRGPAPIVDPISVSLATPLKIVSLSSTKAACDAAAARCTITNLLNSGDSVVLHAIVDAPASGSAAVDVTAMDPRSGQPPNATASLRITAVDHPRRRPAGH